MKEKSGKNVSNPALNLRAGLIRKKRPEEEMLSRLREYLQYSKLKHLLQACPFQVGQTRKSQVCEEKAMEVDVEAWEIPEHCSDEEISTTLPDSDASVLERRDNKYNKENRELAFEVEVEEDDDEESQEEFVPSIKIRRIDDLLLISTVVLKEVALTSSLFAILEEEDKLHILSENQYRTETKAAHTIQVKIQPDFKVDELERKLRFWATNTRARSDP